MSYYHKVEVMVVDDYKGAETIAIDCIHYSTQVVEVMTIDEFEGTEVVTIGIRAVDPRMRGDGFNAEEFLLRCQINEFLLKQQEAQKGAKDENIEAAAGMINLEDLGADFSVGTVRTQKPFVHVASGKDDYQVFDKIPEPNTKERSMNKKLMVENIFDSVISFTSGDKIFDEMLVLDMDTMANENQAFAKMEVLKVFDKMPKKKRKKHEGSLQISFNRFFVPPIMGKIVIAISLILYDRDCVQWREEPPGLIWIVERQAKMGSLTSISKVILFNVSNFIEGNVLTLVKAQVVDGYKTVQIECCCNLTSSKHGNMFSVGENKIKNERGTKGGFHGKDGHAPIGSKNDKNLRNLLLRGHTTNVLMVGIGGSSKIEQQQIATAKGPNWRNISKPGHTLIHGEVEIGITDSFEVVAWADKMTSACSDISMLVCFPLYTSREETTLRGGSIAVEELLHNYILPSRLTHIVNLLQPLKEDHIFRQNLHGQAVAQWMEEPPRHEIMYGSRSEVSDYLHLFDELLELQIVWCTSKISMLMECDLYPEVLVISHEMHAMFWTFSHGFIFGSAITTLRILWRLNKGKGVYALVDIWGYYFDAFAGSSLMDAYAIGQLKEFEDKKLALATKEEGYAMLNHVYYLLNFLYSRSYKIELSGISHIDCLGHMLYAFIIDLFTWSRRESFNNTNKSNISRSVLISLFTVGKELLWYYGAQLVEKWILHCGLQLGELFDQSPSL